MVEYYVRDVGAAGSNPVTSITNEAELSDMKSLFCFLLLAFLLFNTNCRCGGIGRPKGLKIPRSKIRTGSSPVSGTKNIVKSGFFRSPILFFMLFSAKQPDFYQSLRLLTYIIFCYLQLVGNRLFFNCSPTKDIIAPPTKS